MNLILGIVEILPPNAVKVEILNSEQRMTKLDDMEFLKTWTGLKTLPTMILLERTEHTVYDQEITVTIVSQ